MQGELMWKLRQLAFLMEQHAKEQMKELGLSPTQGAILQNLYAAKDGQGPCAANLHAALGLSRPSVSEALKALKKNGYITVAEDPSDGRKKCLALTEKALRAKSLLDAGTAVQEERLCRFIGMARRRALLEDLDLMLKNLKNQPRKEGAE